MTKPAMSVDQTMTAAESTPVSTASADVRLDDDLLPDTFHDLEGEGFDLEQRQGLRCVGGIRTGLEAVHEVAASLAACLLPATSHALGGGAFDLEQRQGLRRVAGIRTDLEDVTEVEYRQLRLERVVPMGVYGQRHPDRAGTPPQQPHA